MDEQFFVVAWKSKRKMKDYYRASSGKGVKGPIQDLIRDNSVGVLSYRELAGNVPNKKVSGAKVTWAKRVALAKELLCLTRLPLKEP